MDRPPSAAEIANALSVLQRAHATGGVIARPTSPPLPAPLLPLSRTTASVPRVGSFSDVGAVPVDEMHASAASTDAAPARAGRARALSCHGVVSSSSSSQANLLVENPTGAGDLSEKAPFKLLKCSDEKCEIVPASDGVVQTSHQSVTKVELNWDQPPRTAMIVRKPDDLEVREKFMETARYLASKGIRILVEPSVKLEAEGRIDPAAAVSPRRSSFTSHTLNAPYPPDVAALLETWAPDEQELLHAKVDFVVCLGGDGTLLWASSLFPNTAVPPVVAFCE